MTLTYVPAPQAPTIQQGVKMTELTTACIKAKNAQRAFSLASHATRCAVIECFATLLVENSADLLKANKLDLENAEKDGKPESFIDRLALSPARITSLAEAMRDVAALPDFLGKTEGHTHANGMSITKTTVPLGVIAAIFESRPNVTADVAALSIKTGNAAILRGGKESINTNLAMSNIIAKALTECGVSSDLIYIVKDTSRATADEILTLRGYIDLLIPRGGAGLINHTVQNSKVPVIETGAGICHVYVDSAAKMDMALSILDNAKTQRPSVCNAAETLLCHEDIAKEFLPKAKEKLDESGVTWYGCSATCEILGDVCKADEASFATEYNDLALNCKVVKSAAEAVEHITKYGTFHSECIVTEDMYTAEFFTQNVDAAVVYHNASTRFTDGGEFGLGAEIGISTQKLQPRGPMGPAALTTIKYQVKGNGQIRK